MATVLYLYFIASLGTIRPAGWEQGVAGSVNVLSAVGFLDGLLDRSKRASPALWDRTALLWRTGPGRGRASGDRQRAPGGGDRWERVEDDGG